MNRSRDRSRSGAASLLAQATAQLGGIAPYHWWDFLNNRALFASADVGGVASTPGWSYTRADAQTAYAQDSAGNLIPFATGVLRRTDKGVLIEGARTNLLLRSQEFDNASWLVIGSSQPTANNFVAPDGTTTGDNFTCSSGLANHYVRQVLTWTAAVHTFSCYLRYGTARYVQVGTWDGTLSKFCTFDLLNGTLGTAANCTAAITSAGGGWYRCTITTSTAQNAASGYVAIAFTDSSNPGALHNNWTAAGTETVGLWGAQLEAASFPSSYIPTGAASATRAADVLTVSSPGVSYPLSLFAEWQWMTSAAGTTRYVFGVNVNGSDADRGILRLASNDTVRSVMTAGGLEQGAVTPSGTSLIGGVYKQSGRFALNDLNCALNGAVGTADTSASLPTAPTIVRFGSTDAQTEFPFFYLRRAAIINSAVNDAGLQAMTT